MSRVGGITQSRPMDSEVREICESIKNEIETSIGKNLTTFEPIEYATQVVAGTNFFVKIKVGDGDYIHARIFRSLPHAGTTISLHSIQSGKTLQDPIAHF